MSGLWQPLPAFMHMCNELLFFGGRRHSLQLASKAMVGTMLVQIFDPYLTEDTYKNQMKNLHWLLGLPFEVFVRLDEQVLLNELKDDVMKDSLQRDMFYGSVHVEGCLDLIKSFEPGLNRLISIVDGRAAAKKAAVTRHPAPKPKAQNPLKKRKAPAPAPAPASAPAPAPAKQPKRLRRPTASSPSVASAPDQVKT